MSYVTVKIVVSCYVLEMYLVSSFVSWYEPGHSPTNICISKWYYDKNIYCKQVVLHCVV